MNKPTLLRRVISGGQTGVDRGALDAAIALGIPHGGKCPRGRLAEDDVIPACYELQEMESKKYSKRTEQNVVDADATLILFYGQLSGGTEFTRRMAIKHRKPYFLYDFTAPSSLEDVARWQQDESVQILNCAGPRESSCQGIGELTRQFCIELFRKLTVTSDPSNADGAAERSS